MRAKENKRCPLRGECERKCAFAGHELDCGYYSANACGDLTIPDQEAIRLEQERRWLEEQEAAGMAGLPDEDEEGLDAPAASDRDIETITGEILRLKQTAGEAILAIGQRLMEAKAMLPHGEWLPWLSERVEFSERTATRFMRLAREWTNQTALSDLGATKALTLLALPANEREEFIAGSHLVDGREKTVIDMSARELEKAIRERDEARTAMEQAQADAQSAENSRAKMETDMAQLQSRYEQAQQEAAALKEAESRAVQAAEEQVSRLRQELEELKAAPVDVAVMAVDQEALDKARAEAVAEMQAKLDKATEAKSKAEEKRKGAEEALAAANARLEEAAKVAKQAAIAADKDMATFAVLFDQGQEIANKLRGIFLKLQKREDPSAAQSVQRAMLALGDAIKGAAV